VKRKQLRAALYHRVSTVDQDRTLARGALRAAARALGARVVLDVEESGSGARSDRPGLLRVLSAARRHELDVVFVWKLDRWGRSLLDVLDNLRALELGGVRFVCTSQGLDFEPGAGGAAKFFLTLLAAAAEFERDLLRERTRLGLDRARRRGKVLGRPKVSRPSSAVVRELRRRGRTWEQVASELKVKVHVARRAALGQ
jgi:putative DNA-invertase from lambdoid prophage Rac